MKKYRLIQFWSVVGSLTALLGHTSLAQSRDFTIAVTSDPRLFTPCSGTCVAEVGDDATKGGKLSSSWQVNSIKELARTEGQNFKGVIINGNLTSNGESNQLQGFKDLWTKPLRNYSVWPGLGVQDYQNNVNTCSSGHCPLRMVEWMIDYVTSLPTTNFHLTTTKKSRWRVTRTYSGSLAYSWDIGDFHFIQLHNHPGYKNSFSKKTYYPGFFGVRSLTTKAEITSSLEWLSADLKKTKKPYVIINVNQYGPLLYSQEFENVIAKDKRVKVIFGGHANGRAGLQTVLTVGEGINSRDVPVFVSGSVRHNTYLKVLLQSNQKRLVIEPMNSAFGEAQGGPYYNVPLD